MAKYRKKPVEVEAVRVSDLLQWASNDWGKLPSYIKDSYEKGDILFLSSRIEINTLEGWMKGQKEDWIIQGVKGELYPCKPDIFNQTYEEC